MTYSPRFSVMRPRLLSLCVMVGMAVLGFVPSAFAATYYVSPSGAGTTCSLASPCGAIATGVGKLSAGDTLYLRGGTYADTVASSAIIFPSGTSWSNAITIAGYPGETATILNGINIQDNLDASIVGYLIFDNLIVRNSTGNAFRVGGNAHHIRLSNSDVQSTLTTNVQITNTASYIEIIACRVHDAPVEYVPVWGTTTGTYGFYINGNHMLIEGNTIYNNTGYAIHMYNSGSTNVSDNIVRNNIIYGNCYNDGGRGQGAGAVIITSGSNNLFYNNLVYGNTGGFCSYGVSLGLTNNAAYNNTIYGNGGRGIEVAAFSSGLIVQNNILYGNGTDAVVDWGSASPVIDHNLIGTNPLFTNAGANDLSLQAGSPAIDAGVTLGVVTTDRGGVARPQGSAYDIGAYEFQGTSTVPTSLHIAQQPVSSPRTTTLPPITVQVLDQFGGLATNVTASVTVALGTNPGIATLSGTLTVTALGGVATFATLSLSALGDGYTLTAVASGLTGDTSTPFDILPNAPITVYVSLPANSPAGSDTRSCNVAQSLSTPLATLAKGRTCLVWPGSTLLLRGGTYAESLDTGTQPITGGTDWSVPTTIAAYPTETVTLQATTGTVLLFFRNGAADHYVVLDRLVLDGAGIFPTNGLAAYPGVHHVRFQRGEIKNTYFEAVFIHQANSVEILTSSLHGNTVIDTVNVESTSDSILISGNDVYASPGRGIRVDADTGANFNAIISGNRVHGTGTGSAVPAIVVGHGSNALVVNNLVYSNAHGISVGASMDAAQVWHNTAYGNTGVGVEVASGATNTQVKNTLISGNGSALTNAGTGTVFATNLCDGAGTGCGVVGSPLFVNAGAADFHLQAGSPARNAGSVLATVLTDFASLPRPSGVGYDIGAYEYQESAAPRLAAIIAFQ